MKYKTTPSILLSLLLLISPYGSADVKAKIGDLSWMTGSWSGSLGPMTLEENWIVATDGSLASLVRMTGDGKTNMIELIVIEEKDDSLVLHVQQWDPGFVPRTPKAQTMKLAEIGDKQVGFKATEPGGMNTLAYSRPTPTTFDINIENSIGAKMQINLQAK
ncbi:MAG: hypothetical protein ACI89U_002268 [Gammaproteobacteria bacterium]|jgi:hypothetical protein